MENRMIKFHSKESNLLQLHAIPGHFATSHSHINYYVDVTTVKTRVSEAREAASVLYNHAPKYGRLDTIVCMDGTEMIGGFLAEEIEKRGTLNTHNTHGSMYVVSPEVNSANQIIFRDNNKNTIEGKHVMLLLATSTTGETIRRAVECINYYGGVVVAVGAIFSTVKEILGIPVDTLFDDQSVLDYKAYAPTDCPFCQKKIRIEALVNGFGYSKL